MAQNTVFHQVIKLIPRIEFESCVAKNDGDKGIRSLNCWTWFGTLLFGQLTGHDSIRAIERVFSTQDKQVEKLGFGAVRKSILADANKKRPVEVLEDLFQYLLGRAYQVAPRRHKKFKFNGDIFAMDSTTIELCLSLCP
jgi:hypothetical protein